jgi:hypothetical protein
VGILILPDGIIMEERDRSLGMQAIQTYSRTARGVVWTIMALITTAWFIGFLFPTWRVWFSDIGPGLSKHLWHNLLYSLPVFILRIAALYQLEKLFQLYQKGRVFELASIRHIRLGGKLFLWSVAVEAVIRSIIAATFIHAGSSPSVVFTFIQPMVGVGTALLIVGLLMLLVSRIMEEACRLSEEVELTV